MESPLIRGYYIHGMPVPYKFTHQVRIDATLFQAIDTGYCQKKNVHPSSQNFLQTILFTTPV
jgi:hypothetical protein